MKNNIKKLLTSEHVSNYQISKETGIAQATLSDYATGKSKIGNMKLDHALKLNGYFNKIKGVLKMKEIYSNLLERLDKTRMESEGVYITFYESLDEYIEDQQEFDYTREEIIEQMSEHVDEEKLDGSFIMLEAQGSEGMYVWYDEDAEDIIDFLKSETAYKKYVK